MGITRTATVIGGTGLIGSKIIAQLQQQHHYETIRVLVRKPYSNANPRIEVKLVDFRDAESFRLGIEGSDAVFCAAGTTQAKVKGNEEAYRQVDFDIPVGAARWCKENGIPQLLLVSSIGADPAARNFYLRIKGETEVAVMANGPTSISIFRPSLLLGERKEHRPGEKIAQAVMPLFSPLLFGQWKKYKPITADDVATAMIAASLKGLPGVQVYEYSEMQALLAK